MNIFKLHITFWFSLHNIDWRTIMCPYLCELGISSTLLKSLSESKADKVAVLVLTESGSRASASLKGWNIVFGHTSQFNLDHMLWPGYRDVVTFRLTIDQVDHVLRLGYRDVRTKWGAGHIRNVPGKHSESPHRFPIEGDFIKKRLCSYYRYCTRWQSFWKLS